MALLAKYADLFNKGASGYTTFAPLAVTAGGAPERYASSPLFCAGVTEPADAFVLRLLVLAYGWPQAFAPLIAFSAKKNENAAMQPVTSMATNAPYMKMVRSNTRPVAAGTNLVGWDVLLQHADRYVLQKYAEGPQLAAEAPAVLAVTKAVLRRFQKWQEARKAHLYLLGCINVWYHGRSGFMHLADNDAPRRLMATLAQFDETHPVYGTSDTFIADTNTIYADYAQALAGPAASQLDAAVFALERYMQSTLALSTGAAADVNGLTLLRAASIPPARMAPLALESDPAARRLIYWVVMMGGVSFFNQAGGTKPVAGVAPKRAGERRGAIYLAARNYADDDAELLALLDEADPDTAGGAVPAKAKRSAESDEVSRKRSSVAEKSVPAPPPAARARKQRPPPAAKGPWVPMPGPASSSSSADAAARAARGGDYVVPPSAIDLEDFGTGFEHDFGTGLAPVTEDDAAVAEALADMAVTGDVMFGDAPSDAYTTSQVSSQAQRGYAAASTPGVAKGDKIPVMLDDTNIWHALTAIERYGHPFRLLGLGADDWLGMVINWYALATQNSAFPSTVTFTQWRRSGLGAVLADDSDETMWKFVRSAFGVHDSWRARLLPLLTGSAEESEIVDFDTVLLAVADANLDYAMPLDVDQHQLSHFASLVFSLARSMQMRGPADYVSYFGIQDNGGEAAWLERMRPAPEPAPARPALINTRDTAHSLVAYARSRLGDVSMGLDHIGLECGRITGRPQLASLIH